MTQWPLAQNSPATPGTPANTFPGIGAGTAFANSTLETFDQANIRTGCMNCHNFTRVKTDFLWSLEDHAFPSNAPNLLLASDLSTKSLVRLLLENPQTDAIAKQQQTLERLNAK
jgi:hypothetical protein